MKILKRMHFLEKWFFISTRFIHYTVDMDSGTWSHTYPHPPPSKRANNSARRKPKSAFVFKFDYECKGTSSISPTPLELPLKCPTKYPSSQSCHYKPVHL